MIRIDDRTRYQVIVVNQTVHIVVEEHLQLKRLEGWFASDEKGLCMSKKQARELLAELVEKLDADDAD
jgi:hypothetical protein